MIATRKLNLWIVVLCLEITNRDWRASIRTRSGLIFGIGSFWGNCFRGAVISVNSDSIKLDVLTAPTRETWISLTFKSCQLLVEGKPAQGKEYIQAKREGKEIERKRYLRPYISWNSTHIAQAFGERKEMDWGTCYFYNGILGNHADV